MNNIFNFCAGPAMLPHDVMLQAQKEFCNWQDNGVSVMEMSHRSPEYMAMASEAEQDLRDLMDIPDNYKVLFCHGGGRGQFSAIPFNLLGDKLEADYLLTGQWSKSATLEAKKYARITDTNIITITEQGKTSVLPCAQWPINAGAAYVHYCPNETVDGIEIFEIPETGVVPLVADMSSTILSRPIDVSKFGLIYAGAQKNIGPAGLAIVIVREDLIGHARRAIPSIFDYEIQAKSNSMYNTPPTYSWYLAGLVFKWLKAQGGLVEVEKRNIEKASLLYSFIDSSNFYENNIDKSVRSRMNIPFTLVDESLNSAFLSASKAAGLLTLKGHKSVGGMRASVYNAMPLAGVQALVKFMADFEKDNI
ncbi:3-phosphoserine/phosphohydroxythreonine aminotransferase [Psychromonas sp. CNPT3]|uniref:3-phosphoserine/phosphohydroxythreonine transaminase n=1 Tax=Psychromonas sp. CNPT3 TaxID=314282 RepID=UPI00006E76B6|nr:3-phosphoserine/phosphohydroxythreonine transaminase [Psychromonas sp. CNPT3]AGH80609.1 3-phosphoserine/phosphohydroxythreonine aminotransferase [Psychromonas sp. CNPT3]